MREMLKSSEEQHQRNGKILQQNVFYHDMISLAKSGFMFYVEGLHYRGYLRELAEFSHIVPHCLVAHP